MFVVFRSMFCTAGKNKKLCGVSLIIAPIQHFSIDLHVLQMSHVVEIKFQMKFQLKVSDENSLFSGNFCMK